MKTRHHGLRVVRWQKMPEKKRKYPGRRKKAGFDHSLLLLERWGQRQGEEEEIRMPRA
jgi:hypothetical protein